MRESGFVLSQVSKSEYLRPIDADLSTGIPDLGTYFRNGFAAEDARHPLAMPAIFGEMLSRSNMPAEVIRPIT